MSLPLHPLAGGSLMNWLKLLQANKGIDNQYLLKGILISVVNIAGVPNRILEKVIFDRQIEKVSVKSPIFIVGHWRSGTTYLHNLMTQDDNLGYVSSLQTWTPELFLGSKPIVQYILKAFLPESRPMDNIKLSGELPQEEEYALGNVSPYSFYHGWYFPKNMRRYFRQFILFETSKEIQQDWREAYLRILQKATFEMNGKRLILKNPANTARIKTLLRMFPEAKFIHIYRNPYSVFLSTKNLYRKLLPVLELQEIDEPEIEDNILWFYRETMSKFFTEKQLIPAANLIEIKYEDFVSNPSDILEKIYEKFDLTEFSGKKAKFARYIAAQSKYKSNRYYLSQEDRDKVTKHWSFAIEKWQYSVPQSQAIIPLRQNLLVESINQINTTTKYKRKKN